MRERAESKMTWVLGSEHLEREVAINLDKENCRYQV